MRNREISFVNVVLCLLVMWIHICSVAVTGLPKENISFSECMYLGGCLPLWCRDLFSCLP